MLSLQQYPIPHRQVSGRVIDDEAVIVLSESGDVEVLNRVGARIWELADGTRTIGEIAQLIEREYDVALPQAQADVQAFVERLIDENIVTLADRPQA
ncbi:MAG: PqqD family protein [Chloroflexi bacterium]|nr:PqqD family protein [Chloroflexota bacterium]